MGNSYFDEKLHFAQIEYGKQPPFSGFLPGIPAWCNYNDRGQAVCSFGMQDKDHAIFGVHRLLDRLSQHRTDGLPHLPQGSH